MRLSSDTISEKGSFAATSGPCQWGGEAELVLTWLSSLSCLSPLPQGSVLFPSRTGRRLMLLKWQEAKLLANPGRRSWILRRCCGSSVTEAAVVGPWHCPSGTVLGQHQWVMSRAWSTGLLSRAGGGTGGVCDSGTFLVIMNSGFPKSQDLRLLAGPTSLQPATIPRGDSCLSLKH